MSFCSGSWRSAVSTVVAAVAGSAYSNDYKVPGTESGRAAQLLQKSFPDMGGDSDTIVWHTASTRIPYAPPTSSRR